MGFTPLGFISVWIEPHSAVLISDADYDLAFYERPHRCGVSGRGCLSSPSIHGFHMQQFRDPRLLAFSCQTPRWNNDRRGRDEPLSASTLNNTHTLGNKRPRGGDFHTVTQSQLGATIITDHWPMTR